MVKTASTMLPLGSDLPSFDLPLINKKMELENIVAGSCDRINSRNLNNKPVLIMIICAHCPFVKHIEEALTHLGDDYVDKVNLIAVSSNSVETHPEDGPKYLFRQKVHNRWSFPYLIDFDQTLAKSLRAACTPDFFLFSSAFHGKQELIYRGQLDNSRPGNTILPTGSDVRSALDAALGFRKLSIEQKPSIGCNIKWRPGFEPFWFK